MFNLYPTGKRHDFESDSRLRMPRQSTVIDPGINKCMQNKYKYNTLRITYKIIQFYNYMLSACMKPNFFFVFGLKLNNKKCINKNIFKPLRTLTQAGSRPFSQFLFVQRLPSGSIQVRRLITNDASSIT